MLTKEQQDKFWSKVDIRGIDDCWEWQASTNEKGYGQIMFDRKHYKAHRIAFALVFGYMPTLFLLHSCNNPRCVNPNHLREGTNKDNMRDLRNSGRRIKKLSLEQVAAIRKMEGTQKAIAEEFGVNETLVSQIQRGVIYKGVIS